MGTPPIDKVCCQIKSDLLQFIESFNGSLRDERLNVHWFLSLTDTGEKIECWRLDYDEFRPHSSLGNLTSSEFRLAHLEVRNFELRPLG